MYFCIITFIHLRFLVNYLRDIAKRVSHQDFIIYFAAKNNILISKSITTFLCISLSHLSVFYPRYFILIWYIDFRFSPPLCLRYSWAFLSYIYLSFDVKDLRLTRSVCWKQTTALVCRISFTWCNCEKREIYFGSKKYLKVSHGW